MSAEYDSHTKKRVLPSWMKLCDAATNEKQDEPQSKKSRETRIQEAADTFDKILNDSLSSGKCSLEAHWFTPTTNLTVTFCVRS